jgi:hypothetical protein
MQSIWREMPISNILWLKKCGCGLWRKSIFSKKMMAKK